MLEPLRPSCRVLIVEDEPMVAMEIEYVVATLGHTVVGPVAELAKAWDLTRGDSFDCAVLDVNVRGGHTTELADELLQRGVPVLLASGYADWAIGAHFAGQPRLTKPFSTEELERSIGLLCARVQPAG